MSSSVLGPHLAWTPEGLVCGQQVFPIRLILSFHSLQSFEFPLLCLKSVILFFPGTIVSKASFTVSFLKPPVPCTGPGRGFGVRVGWGSGLPAPQWLEWRDRLLCWAADTIPRVPTRKPWLWYTVIHHYGFSSRCSVSGQGGTGIKAGLCRQPFPPGDSGNLLPFKLAIHREKGEPYTRSWLWGQIKKQNWFPREAGRKLSNEQILKIFLWIIKQAVLVNSL